MEYILEHFLPALFSSNISFIYYKKSFFNSKCLNLSIDNPSKKPPTDEPVNECEEFCCMFSTTLNGQRILYGAEMDGIESDHSYDLNDVDLNQLNFVELKVKIREQNHRQKQNYHRFKLRNWWYVRN